ncbi:hypothetical protein ACFOLD_08065 [Kocuria carniphila]|uniref:hypothetical protein n=1 Tax=Kocuria carniphila TaxID=262208 RepID=UPI003607CFC0
MLRGGAGTHAAANTPPDGEQGPSSDGRSDDGPLFFAASHGRSPPVTAEDEPAEMNR